MLNPTWSPDGKLIAFSGLVGGFNDLFVYDLEASAAAAADDRSVRRARSGLVARRPAARVQHRSLHDQPRDARVRRSCGWRCSTSRRGSGRRSAAASTTPRTSARSGRPTARRSTSSPTAAASRTSTASSSAAATTQLTNLLTGASGITALSPAMSAAGGRLVFSAYEDDGYSIYALETRRAAGGRGAGRAAAQRGRAAAAARRRGAGRRRAAERRRWACRRARSRRCRRRNTSRSWGSTSPASRRSASASIRSAPMRPAASRSSSATCSATTSSATGAQVTSRFDEFGGSADLPEPHAPLELGRRARPDAVRLARLRRRRRRRSGQPVYVEDEYRILQTDRSAAGLIVLSVQPRRSASSSAAGSARSDSSRTSTTRLFDFNTGQQLIAGAHGPRGRADAEPRRGVGGARVRHVDLRRHQPDPRQPLSPRAVAERRVADLHRRCSRDFRTYLMPVRPFTFAFRGLYYGRYGSDAEDQRLPALYLGYPGLVRGYDSGLVRVGRVRRARPTGRARRSIG